MKVVILCGGFGTRLREETEVRPKPMVEVGGKPILWHIMKTFAHYGFIEFILCLGYKGEVIKNYFMNYEYFNNDFEVELGTGKIHSYNQHQEQGWKVTLAETGLNTMTGARLKKVAKYIDDEIFMLTYGDGVTDCNINELLEFHKSNGKIGTVTGVSPPSRYGELAISGNTVVSFQEKPQTHDSLINGGYFVFNRQFFDYLADDEGCVLERAPLEQLASDNQLSIYSHHKFWQCMDTQRDHVYLNELWDQGLALWKVWQDN